MGTSTQPYKYNGKELDKMHQLNLYNYSVRYYEYAIGRFTTVDLMAEKCYSISPYVYCNNNPLKYIDPMGMYFDPVNEKRAQEMEKNLNKQIGILEKDIANLEKKGKDIGNGADRLIQLQQSQTDISDMRANKNTEFRYAKASDKNNPAGKGNPVTSKTGVNTNRHDIVTMFSDRIGSQIHETRHGGQIARGDYGFDQQGNPTSGYGINSEVSAYKAQYSYDGKLTYLDTTDAENQQVANTGMMSMSSILTNINSITPNFIKTQIGEFRSAIIRGNRVSGLTPLYVKLP